MSKGEHGDNQRLSVGETIRVFTISGAFAVGAEERIVSLEIGKLADFIVLNCNLLEIEQTEIRNTNVVNTVVDGRVVYKSN